MNHFYTAREVASSNPIIFIIDILLTSYASVISNQFKITSVSEYRFYESKQSIPYSWSLVWDVFANVLLWGALCINVKIVVQIWLKDTIDNMMKKK